MSQGLLTSKRKFGIEIEFLAPSEQSLRNIRNQLNVVEDGSLRPLRNAGEWVSNVLMGASGERVVSQACEILKKNGAESTHQATSVHVHLDGNNKVESLRASRNRPEYDGTIIGVSDRAKTAVTKSYVLSALKTQNFGHLSVAVSQVDNVIYYSKVPIQRHPKMNYTYYWLPTSDRFNWLRNVLYFYTMYSEVMEDIVSNSRRFGNMYCIPLGKSYELDVIEGAQNLKQLKNVWYKGRPPNGHYDDSRYHNVNLHCFWDRHGTVEIRSHGGTIDPDKILLWVKLHQCIVDKLEDMTLDEIKLTHNDGELIQSFLNFLEDPLLIEYVKRLHGYYSNK